MGAKTRGGLRSLNELRRDLVATMFVSHYEQRFRDNERRTIENTSTRGPTSS